MIIIFIIVFINLVGFGIIIPLLPFYGERFGASPDEVTWLMAIYSLTQFATAPIWGRYSDRYGRRPILLLSLAGTVVAYVWLSQAANLEALYWARGLAGIAAGSISAAFACMSDITTKENRSKGMGLIGAAFGLGFIAGPAIGGLLAGSDPATTDYELPSLVAAGFSGVALATAFFILKETLSYELKLKIKNQSANERWLVFKGAMNQPTVRLTITLTFVSILAFAGLEATFALWSERSFGWGVAQNGYIFAFIGTISAFIQGTMIGFLSQKFGEVGMVKQGFLALGVGLAILPFTNNLPTLLITLVVIAYGFSISSPALNTLLSLNVPDEQQGSILGIGRSASTLARALGPAISGYLFAFIGKNWPFYIGAFLILIVLILTLNFPKNTQESKLKN
jgi:DHA1 family tetracycline resistance protein-like MFS transporter